MFAERKKNTGEKKERELLLLSALLTLFQFIAVYFIFPPMMNGDDYMTDLALSGGYNGTPLTLYPYNNILLIKAISKLYVLSTAVPFYSAFLVLTLYVSCAVIQYSFFCTLRKKNYPIWAAEILYLIFYFVYILSSSTGISFTLVAGICGCSAVSLIVSTDYKGKCFLTKSCFSLLFILLACLIRPESGYVPLCFLLLSYVFVVLSDCAEEDRKGKKKRTISVIAFFAVALGSVFCFSYADKILRSEPDAQFISDWNKNRSVIVDYKGLSYEEDSEFLNSIGWNEEFYALEETFYNLDSKCDYSHYSAIRQYAESKPSLSFCETIRKTFSTIIGFSKSLYFIPLFGVMAVLLAYCLMRAFGTGTYRRRLTAVYIICAFGGTLLMWIYLTYIGRFVAHVFRLTVLQLAVCMFFASVNLTDRMETTVSDRKMKNCGYIMAVFSFVLPLILTVLQIRSCLKTGTINKVEFICFSVIFCAVLYISSQLLIRQNEIKKVCIRVVLSGILALCLSSTMTVVVAADGTVFLGRQDKYLEEQKYAVSHPNEVLVTARTYTPVKINSIYKYGNNRSNIFCKVDFLMFSDVYNEKLHVNNLEKLDIASYFEKENVYYIGNTENDDTLNKLLAYMKTQYGETVSAIEHERLDNGVSVFEFEK